MRGAAGSGAGAGDVLDGTTIQARTIAKKLASETRVRAMSM
jgi:hypothetical protein